MKKVIIDLRSKDSYLKGHLNEAFSFPWENIRNESCGLPPRDTELTVIIDENIDLSSVEAYLNRFHFALLEIREIKESDALVTNLPKGTPWSPNPFLVNVINLIETNNGGSSFAVDVGSGTGRDMVFLASRGWNVIGIENRRRLIDQGISLGQKHNVINKMLFIYCNLKEDFPIRSGTVDLLHVCRFLHRPSLNKLLELPRYQGHLVYSHFLEGCKETEVGHPSTPAGFFLNGELRQILENAGYFILSGNGTELPDGRPIVNILARRVRGGGGPN